jgi:small subunit ribosomal protein S13
MLRIAGINIPENKQIAVGLTYIYGIGPSLSKRILAEANISSSVKGKDLKGEEVNSLKQIIEKKYKVEGDLRREKMMAIKRLKDIGCWRGIRHIKKLPVRGQRTKTNTRTIRGNVRKTMGSGKRKAVEPT